SSSRSRSYVSSVYRRYAWPGRVRPARPARCLAATFEIGTTVSASMPLAGWNCFCLTNPQSTTYTMPSTVIVSSQMLVELQKGRDRMGGEKQVHARRETRGFVQ